MQPLHHDPKARSRESVEQGAAELLVELKNKLNNKDYSDLPIPGLDLTVCEGITEEQRQLLHVLTDMYRHLFVTSIEELGSAKGVQHLIDTGDAYPFRQKMYRAAKINREIIDEELDRMLAGEIIKRSNSPWASPVVIVTKKDGSPRFCVDFRKLNQMTRKDAYPIPRIDDTLEALAGSQYFSTMDAFSGYWQIDVAPEDRPKTAFTTHQGLFKFNKMPFGLCNAPATFQ